MGEYHSSKNWKGLLDPLDENLEVVRYGEFIQPAYHSFHFDPAMSAQEPQTIFHLCAIEAISLLRFQLVF
jgi:hypothetical protein